jgi:hypothetical protein
LLGHGSNGRDEGDESSKSELHFEWFGRGFLAKRSALKIEESGSGL